MCLCGVCMIGCALHTISPSQLYCDGRMNNTILCVHCCKLVVNRRGQGGKKKNTILFFFTFVLTYGI